MSSSSKYFPKYHIDAIIEDENEGIDDDTRLNGDKQPIVSTIKFPTNKISESLLRASRSTGPREILLKLAINRHMLQLQLSAVKIQCLIRKFVAKRNVERIRTYFAMFHRTTQDICNRYLEETVLSICFKEALGFLRTFHRYKLLQSSINTEMNHQTTELLDEVNQQMCRDIVRELFLDVANNYLSFFKPHSELELKPLSTHDRLRQSRNPLINVMLDCCDELIDEMKRGIVIQAIQEEVQAYLINVYSNELCSRVLYEEVVMEFIYENYIAVLQSKQPSSSNDDTPDSPKNKLMTEFQTSLDTMQASFPQQPSPAKRNNHPSISPGELNQLIEKSAVKFVETLLLQFLS